MHQLGVHEQPSEVATSSGNPDGKWLSPDGCGIAVTRQTRAEGLVSVGHGRHVRGRWRLAERPRQRLWIRSAFRRSPLRPGASSIGIRLSAMPGRHHHGGRHGEAGFMQLRPVCRRIQRGCTPPMRRMAVSCSDARAMDRPPGGDAGEPRWLYCSQGPGWTARIRWSGVVGRNVSTIAKRHEAGITSRPSQLQPPAMTGPGGDPASNTDPSGRDIRNNAAGRPP